MKSKAIAPLRDHMRPEAFYADLDPGIRFAVRVLHASGIETCQSCQGGVRSGGWKRHAYDVPTVDVNASAADATGFAALAALRAYGLPVDGISLHWSIRNGLPYDKVWRITFSATMQDRADEKPTFVFGYRAQ